MSPAEETLAVSTDGGQLYSISLSAVGINQVSLSPGPDQSSPTATELGLMGLVLRQEHAAYFCWLAQSFHSKAITGLSVCIRKPIVATSSLDRCVRVWNYETK